MPSAEYCPEDPLRPQMTAEVHSPAGAPGDNLQPSTFNLQLRSGSKGIARVFLIAILAFASSIQAAEPELTAKDLPRAPFVPPAEALKTIRFKKGFHVELVTAEPNVESPVAMAFDERSRLFVVEMIDYSERREIKPHLGRIRLLEDTHGTGVFDKSSVFADNLPWPTAVFCYNGGIFVGATPDILYLKDTDGDGKADVREVVFTGFAEGMERINVQEMLNSFNWGLDNRIHGATSGDGGQIKSLRHPEAGILDLRGRDFAIEPRTMSMVSEAGGGQHGLSFDDYGRRFTCNNSDHIRLFMYDDRYAARNPYCTMPPSLTSIAADGPAAEVFRISPEEPWRVIRTRWRVAGLVSGPVEGGGRSSGYFTGATGITIYRGNAFPAEFLDNAFIGECAGNLLHRKLLLPDDVGLKAQRAADESNVEFLASTDDWFRPVQFANAPDGTLYVIDMHREIVEHPWSLPENIKKFLDLNSGAECGRLFRIVPDGFKQPPLPRLDRAGTTQLVAELENRNGWHRDTAARLLYERQDPAAVPALTKLAAESKFPLARMHALYALAGLGALTATGVERALGDQDSWVRVHALRLAEKFARDPAAGSLWRKTGSLAGDPSNQVRYQLAFTLGEFTNAPISAALAQIARRDAASPWIESAVLSSLSGCAGEVFGAVLSDQGFCKSEGGQSFLRQLVGVIGAKKETADLRSVMEYIPRLEDPALGFSILRSLGEGLRRSGASLARIAPAGYLEPIFGKAEKVAADRQAPELARVEAVRMLGLADFDRAQWVLVGLLTPPEPEPVQLAAISTLSRFGQPQVAADLLQHWADFSSRARSQTVGALLARSDRALALLQAIAAKQVDPSALTTAQVRFLRNHAQTDVRQLALKVFPATAPNQRQAVVEAFQPALKLKGDAAKGGEIFVQRCTSCHRLSGAGYTLGPDLVSVKSNGKEKLLVSILDPNREVAPQYIAFEVETKDDESYVGIMVNETPAGLTIRQAYGKEDVIPRSNIRRMRSQKLSLMPEGLEQGLSQQDLANLLEYVSTANPQ
jgi:putative membrane-bound dehydrogenase-like protein